MGYSNSKQPVNQRVQHQRDNQPPAIAQFVDNRASVAAQLQLQGLMDFGPRMTAQRKIQTSIQVSPVIRQQPIQRVEDKELTQDKFSREPAVQLTDVPQLSNQPNAGGVISLAKDPALWSSSDADSGKTKLKLIKTKSGSTGLYRYAYSSGKVIDSFSGNSAAAIKNNYSGSTYASKKISDYDAGSDIIHTEFDLTGHMDSSVIAGGDRAPHFDVANEKSGKTDDDKTTWHHKATFGKMQLLDMNIHGAFYHHGGIKNWDARGLEKSEPDEE